MNTYDKRYKWGLASEVFFGCRFGKRWSFLCLLKVLLKYLKVSALERTLLFIWPEFPAISVCFSLFETCPLSAALLESILAVLRTINCQMAAAPK